MLKNKSILSLLIVIQTCFMIGCATDDMEADEDLESAALQAESPTAMPHGAGGVYAVVVPPDELEVDTAAAEGVDLHQINTVWDPNVANQVKITIRNKGTVDSSAFWYNFTINGWYNTVWYKQNNSIRAGYSVKFFCYASGMTLTSCEMNGDRYYIAPDDITPQ